MHSYLREMSKNRSHGLNLLELVHKSRDLAFTSICHFFLLKKKTSGYRRLAQTWSFLDTLGTFLTNILNKSLAAPIRRQTPTLRNLYLLCKQPVFNAPSPDTKDTLQAKQQRVLSRKGSRVCGIDRKISVFIKWKESRRHGNLKETIIFVSNKINSS